MKLTDRALATVARPTLADVLTTAALFAGLWALTALAFCL